MSHRNAPLTETGRLRPARCVVDEGRPLRRAAERFQVSRTTAARRATRHRRFGIAGMSAGPPVRTTSRCEPRPQSRNTFCGCAASIGSLGLAARCGIAPSIAQRILTRHGLPPLAALDRATGEPVRRHEGVRPGERVHIDVK